MWFYNQKLVRANDSSRIQCSIDIPLCNLLIVLSKRMQISFLGRLLAILMEQQLDSLLHLSRTPFNRKLIYGSTYVFQWNYVTDYNKDRSLLRFPYPTKIYCLH